MYLTILKYLLLVAMGLTLVFVPYYYVSKEITSARTEGFSAGRAACVSEWKDAEAARERNIQRSIIDERNATEQFRIKNSELQGKLNSLKKALNDKAKEKPAILGCGFDPDLVGVWRNAASGTSTPSTSTGAISGKIDRTLSYGSKLPDSQGN